MNKCKHNYIRIAIYTWKCNKCNQAVISLLMMFTPEFGKLFIEKGYEAYRLFKGEVFREIK